MLKLAFSAAKNGTQADLWKYEASLAATRNNHYIPN